VYYRYGGGEGVILCLYVNDILIFGTSTKVIDEIKSFLSRCFDMKDLGPADVILNIKLIKSEDGITLNQSRHAERILSWFGFEDCKISPTPYDATIKLCKFEGEGKDQLRYLQIIWPLMYLAGATRPDISYAMSRLSMFTSNLGDDHSKALERVLRYLRGTTLFGIHYSRYPPALEGYSDSNWISDVDETKATRGYVFMLAGAAVLWRSCKQTVLTKSTIEEQLVALETSTNEAEWLRELLTDLPIVDKLVSAILMYCDNQSMLAQVINIKDNSKSNKHIKHRLKSVRKMENSGEIVTSYVKSENNLAAPFTKGLPRNVISMMSKNTGMRPI
jgi:hypothetical protein